MGQRETKLMTAHIPLPLAEKVDRLAARLERPHAWIIRQALSAWVDNEEQHEKLTREAMADVDTGRLIAHEAMQTWADSLDSDNPLPPPALP